MGLHQKSIQKGVEIVSDLIVDVGVVLTGIGTWFTSLLGTMETAIGTSILLQLLLGVAGAGIAFWLIRSIFRVVKSIKAGK